MCSKLSFSIWPDVKYLKLTYLWLCMTDGRMFNKTVNLLKSWGPINKVLLSPSPINKVYYLHLQCTTNC